MNKSIDEKTLKHLAGLARIEIDDADKLLNDLQKILEYFENLKEVDVEKTEPLLGAAAQKNIFREDEPRTGDEIISSEDLRKSFPETENGFLKTPAVFQGK